MRNTQIQHQVEGNAFHFISGGGEMGELTRRFDWSKTSIGPPEDWPQSLKLTVAMILSSKFPMFLWWGDDLVQFYNDAYRPSLGNNGKHPRALGQKGEECWPEIWDIIYPLIEQVITRGEATWSEDQLVPIYRNGKIEDVYWTFSYSPIRDDSSRVEGVLVVCTETTEKVLVNKRLSQSEQNLRNMVLQAPVAMCILLGPDHVVDIANETMIKLWGKNASDVMNRPIFDGLPEAKAQGLEALLEHVYASGESFRANERPVELLRNGRLQTVYQNFVYEPYKDSDGTILGVLAISIDVTDQVLARRKIEEREERFRTVADSAPVMIWMADPEKIRNFFNKSWLLFRGRRMEEEKGTGWTAGIHPDDRERFIKVYTESFDARQEYYIEYRLQRHDGIYRWINARGLPLFSTDGKFEGYIGACTDINDMKELEQRKDDFIRMASHELKTPITSIKGYTQLLLETHDTIDSSLLKTSLSTIDKQVSKLTKLVSDLLDVSRIDTGNLAVIKTSFPINDLVKEVVDDIASINFTHNIIITESGMFPVFADRDRIAQVLINLLTNAIKYAPRAENILIHIDRDESNVIVSVEDFGIGISTADQAKIFERFYRVQGKSEQTFPGFGIGLFISSEIIRLNEGRIWVQSEKDKGTVFSFSLKIHE